jgi:putative membrane protein
VVHSPIYARAQAWSARWGVLAVPMSFLTIGLQSVIQISTGVTHMPLRHYAAATTVGAIAWAAVYTTIGMAVLTAWLTGPVGRIVCLLMIAALGLTVVVRRSRVVRDNQGGKRSNHG